MRCAEVKSAACSLRVSTCGLRITSCVDGESFPMCGLRATGLVEVKSASSVGACVWVESLVS